MLQIIIIRFGTTQVGGLLPCLRRLIELFLPESDCNSELPTGEWGFSDPYFSITDDSWDVYALFRCKAGLFIRKDVSIERIDCIFEPDYYMSSWGKDPSKCIGK